jgi:hypothetical protein
MRNLLAFKNPEELEEPVQYSAFQEEIHERLWRFHRDLIHHCSMPSAPEEAAGEEEKEKTEEKPPPSAGEKLLQLVWKAKEEAPVEEAPSGDLAPGLLFSSADLRGIFLVYM